MSQQNKVKDVICGPCRKTPGKIITPEGLKQCPYCEGSGRRYKVVTYHPQAAVIPATKK